MSKTIDDLSDIAEQTSCEANLGTRSKRGIVGAAGNPAMKAGRRQPSFRGRIRQAQAVSDALKQRPITLPKVDL